MEHFRTSRWIGGGMTVDDRFAPIFKKELSIKSGLKSARVFICGLGLFELKINGHLPDDTVLNPAHSQYSQTVCYRAFDIKGLLSQGENTVTVELGHSFFNETVTVWDWDKASWRSAPKLIAEIGLEYENGETEIVPTDESWLVTHDGPITANSIYYGETHDARRKSRNWRNAVCVEPPKGGLKEQKEPFIRRIEAFSPKRITRVGESFVVETPEMTTGWAAIRIREPENTEVTVTYSEKLTADGSVQMIGKHEGHDGNWFPDAYIQQDKFISGGNEAVFEPKFSYKGFKYFQIDGCTDIQPDDIVIYKIANSVETVSEFECSDEMLNSLHAIMRRTMLNNFQSKPTDTPVWEKNGWLGDANCALETMMYNFDMNGYMQSFVDTMADCLHEFGKVPVIVPSADWGVDNSPVWNTIFVFAPLALHDFCGNSEYLEKLYPDLRRFALDDIGELRSLGNVWGTRGLSDWVSPSGDENSDVIADPSEGAEICCTAYIYAMLGAMVRIAEILGKTDDKAEYESAAEDIAKAFNEKFYNPEKGIYETTLWNQKGCRDGSYRQTSNLLPLAFGLVPEENRERVLKNLADNFIRRGYRLDTGCTGTKHVLPVLFGNGYADIASKVMLQTEYPSWGYWVKKGSDSAWESWETTTRSLNHYFLGTCDEAYYSYIGGIRNVRNGYESFTVAPVLDCPLDWAKVSIKTPRGVAACEWKKENGSCKVKVTVPENSRADISLVFGKKKISATVSCGEYEYVI